jgi:DNA polymerase-3 subunit alpha
MGLKLVLPDVNVSEYTFTVDGKGQIVYGLGAVKGLGEGPVGSVLQARAAGGEFKNLFDFCARVDLKKVNKRSLEAMIKSGCFDHIGPDRARLMASIEEAVQRAGQNSRNLSFGMDDLFGEVVPDEDEDVYQSSVGVRPWNEKDQLDKEKETLGLFLTGHPFHAYEEEVRKFISTPISELKANKSKSLVAGLVVDSRIMKTKKGQNMAFVTLDDRTARIEVSFFAEACDRCRHLIANDDILFVEGEVRADRPFDAQDDSASSVLKVRADNAFDITEARRRYAKKLQLTLDVAAQAEAIPGLKKAKLTSKSFIELIKEALTPHLLTVNDMVDNDENPASTSASGASQCHVSLIYKNDDVEAEFIMGNEWNVMPADELLEGLKFRLGDANVEMVY